MNNHNLTITKLEGFSGISLKDNKPLVFKPGLNLLVGRNGSGKTNLLRFINMLATQSAGMTDRIESSYFKKLCEDSLRNNDLSPEIRFEDWVIAEYEMLGQKGTVTLSMKGVTQEHVLKNIMRDGAEFRHSIHLASDTLPIKHHIVYSNQQAPKLEMSGHVMNWNVLSKEHANPLHETISSPIQEVSEFVRNNLIEFYNGSEFLSRISNLEKQINERYSSFLGPANKEVKINCTEIGQTGRVSLSLMDKGNVIHSEGVSTGEATLFNLVVALTTLKTTGCDILSLDEPDIHMHNDMTQVLVDELMKLSVDLSRCIIIIATHSTTMIERLVAQDNVKINIITFDHDRKVANSEDDVELINALVRNGVTFSPLMLSKRKNIFIENRFKGAGKNHRDFLLALFAPDTPNVIPVGSSDNVQDSESFMNVFEDIIQTSKTNSIGIRDGDIWFKSHLTNYLRNVCTLSEVINQLRQQGGIYIQEDQNNKNAYYFNFWEIENLYLFDELIGCWRKSGQFLTAQEFRKIVKQNFDQIANQYFSMFYKYVLRVKPNSFGSTTQVRDKVKIKTEEINAMLSDPESLHQKVHELVTEILKEDLIHWIPGKEIKQALQNEGYRFDQKVLDSKNLRVSARLREILK